jgi:hypothetical protein
MHLDTSMHCGYVARQVAWRMPLVTVRAGVHVLIRAFTIPQSALGMHCWSVLGFVLRAA